MIIIEREEEKINKKTFEEEREGEAGKTTWSLRNLLKRDISKEDTGRTPSLSWENP